MRRVENGRLREALDNTFCWEPKTFLVELRGLEWLFRLVPFTLRKKHVNGA
jgi:hypothetical protein